MARARPIAYLRHLDNVAAHMQKTVTTADARRWPCPVSSAAALEPPKIQLCCLLGGAGPVAAASARADARLIPGVSSYPHRASETLPIRVRLMRTISFSTADWLWACGLWGRVDPSADPSHVTAARLQVDVLSSFF